MILITGASGFIGGEIIQYFFSRGFKVASLGRTVVENFPSYEVDLSNLELLASVAEEIETPKLIIHCAALAHGQKPPGGYSIQSYNSLLLDNMLKAFSDDSIHWIFISSVSIYGIVSKNLPVSIFTEPCPIDDYGSGKLRDEKMILRSKSRVDVMRLAPTYSDKILGDIQKRVYLPMTKVKLRVFPSPSYSFCEISEVLKAVESRLDVPRGKFLLQVTDDKPTSQSMLLERFRGPWIPFPQVLGVFFIFLFTKLPNGFLRISAHLSKFTLDNIFLPGSREI